MVTKGFSTENGPIAVMLHDHVEGREFVKGMSIGIEKYKEGDTAAISTIYFNMNGYGELLRAHINKENNILFRMADNILSETEQENLLMEFTKIESESYGNYKIQEFISIIENLEKLYK
jgi:hemerythrin-like domain-containing protein